MPTRLAGHALWGEGKPYVERDGRVSAVRPFATGVSGTGFAVCECGWRSDVTASSVIRRREHREHKRAVREGAR